MPAALLLAAALAYPALSDEANRKLAGVPKSIGAFLERRAECDHWAGEEPYDKERLAEINRAVRDLRCGGLDMDERALRKKYAKRKDWLKLMDVE